MELSAARIARAYTDDAIDGTDCSQHMGGIGPLSTSSRDEAALLTTGEHGLKQHIFLLPFDES
jgi:hypothetical protein